MSDPQSGNGQSERRPERAAFIIAVALAVLAAIVLWDAYRLGAVASYSRVGPATFPKVIGFGLAGLALWTAISAWRGDYPEREAQNYPPMLWVIGGLAAQMLLLNVAGFSIATACLFAATARAFGRGPLWLTLPIGFVLSLAVWIVFADVLQLSLPAGPIERLF